MKLIYTAIGFSSLGLGILGAFLPLLPTTCFVLLSAWCFAKSSPRWHAWLLNSNLFGAPLRRWERHRCISLTTKVIASLSMVISGGISYVAIDNSLLKSAVIGAIALGIYSVWAIRKCEVSR